MVGFIAGYFLGTVIAIFIIIAGYRIGEGE